MTEEYVCEVLQEHEWRWRYSRDEGHRCGPVVNDDDSADDNSNSNSDSDSNNSDSDSDSNSSGARSSGACRRRVPSLGGPGNTL